MPYYTLLRTFNYTKSMIDDNFKPLIQARQLEVFIFYIGIIFGSCLILLAIGMTVIIYKLRKQQERRAAIEEEMPEELNNSFVPLEDE